MGRGCAHHAMMVSCAELRGCHRLHSARWAPEPEPGRAQLQSIVLVHAVGFQRPVRPGAASVQQRRQCSSGPRRMSQAAVPAAPDLRRRSVQRLAHPLGGEPGSAPAGSPAAGIAVGLHAAHQVAAISARQAAPRARWRLCSWLQHAICPLVFTFRRGARSQAAVEVAAAHLSSPPTPLLAAQGAVPFLAARLVLPRRRVLVLARRHACARHVRGGLALERAAPGQAAPHAACALSVALLPPRARRCHFFLQGKCRFGGDCRFSHTLPQTEDGGSSSSGRVRDHEEEEEGGQEEDEEAVRRTEEAERARLASRPLCTRYMPYGVCFYGERCHFLHGDRCEVRLKRHGRLRACLFGGTARSRRPARRLCLLLPRRSATSLCCTRTTPSRPRRTAPSALRGRPSRRPQPAARTWSAASALRRWGPRGSAGR